MGRERVHPANATEHPCARCGYSRIGISPTTLCPECGAPSPLGRGEVSGGERSGFSTGHALGIFGTGSFAVILALNISALASFTCPLISFTALVAVMAAYRRSRREVPKTWRCDSAGLTVTLPKTTLTLPWSAIAVCRVERMADRRITLLLEGRMMASANRRLRCDASESEARILAELIRERIHGGAVELGEALRDAPTVRPDELAIRLMRRFPAERLEIECVVCGAGRPWSSAAKRCICGAAGWDPAWMLIPVRNATWVTRDELAASSSSRIVRALVAPVAESMLASVKREEPKTGLGRVRALSAPLLLIAGVLLLLLWRPPTAPTGIDWWMLLALGPGLFVTAMVVSPLTGWPRALVVVMQDRVVLLVPGRGIAIRPEDAASFLFRRSWGNLLVGGLDERGQPTLAFSFQARAAALDALHREFDARLKSAADRRIPPPPIPSPGGNGGNALDRQPPEV